MFEKDAEETVDKSTWLFQQSKELAKDFWQKGAEFGYNKSNEWHKADVPTTPINKVVLGYIKDYNTKKFCLVKWNGEWWYDARTWNDKVKLIAWKEIVLPELPKESEIRSDMFPEIILPEGSAEFVEKIIADAEKRLKESK